MYLGPLGDCVNAERHTDGTSIATTTSATPIEVTTTGATTTGATTTAVDREGERW